MGVNYYLKKRDGSSWRIPKPGAGAALERACLASAEVGDDAVAVDVNACVEGVDKLHVGKSSVGWHFALCVYPALGIYGLADYKKLFEKDDLYAVDEYGDEIPIDELIDRIVNRRAHAPATVEEAEANGADLGVNGLFAHRSGVWDPRKDPVWEGFSPKLYPYYRTDGPYDLTTDWDFR